MVIDDGQSDTQDPGPPSSASGDSDPASEMEVDQMLNLRSDSIFDRIILYLATTLFIGTIVLATAQVVVRVFSLPIGNGLYWTEPLARILLIIVTFIGAAVASRNHEHISINIFMKRISKWSPGVASVIELTVAASVIVFLLLVAYTTLRAALNSWNTTFGGAGILSMGMVYIMISFGLALMALYEGYNFTGLVGSTRNLRYEVEE